VPGREYLVYLPNGGTATLDVTAAQGELSVEWMHPITGKITPGEPVEGGGRRALKAPFEGDAVLIARRLP
jgi:Putative collagen-binding domain of a collagenase